jgi:hypothetical protein
VAVNPKAVAKIDDWIEEYLNDRDRLGTSA